MSYAPHRGDVQISYVHNLALCREIGERLGISMGGMPMEVPPHLMRLMNRLREESSNRSKPDPTSLRRRDLGRVDLTRYPSSKSAAMTHAIALGCH